MPVFLSELSFSGFPDPLSPVFTVSACYDLFRLSFTAPAKLLPIPGSHPALPSSGSYSSYFPLSRNLPSPGSTTWPVSYTHLTLPTKRIV